MRPGNYWWQTITGEWIQERLVSFNENCEIIAPSGGTTAPSNSTATPTRCAICEVRKALLLFLVRIGDFEIYVIEVRTGTTAKKITKQFC